MKYLSIAAASRIAGVNPGTIRAMVRRHEIVLHDVAGFRRPQVDAADLPKIESRRRDWSALEPLPTSVEIRQRCKEVRAQRLERCPFEQRQRKTMALFEKHPMLTVDDVMGCFGWSREIAGGCLNALEATDTIRCIGTRPRQFALASADVNQLGMESTEAILKRIRKCASKRSTRRSCVASQPSNRHRHSQ